MVVVSLTFSNLMTFNKHVQVRQFSTSKAYCYFLLHNVKNIWFLCFLGLHFQCQPQRPRLSECQRNRVNMLETVVSTNFNTFSTTRFDLLMLFCMFYLINFVLRFIGGLNLSKVSVKGVAAALEKHTGENIESKGIKAHFRY